jgi:hypothetical protein
MRAAMPALIEKVLLARYGAPTISASGAEHVWNASDEDRRCTLFAGLSWDTALRRKHGVLEPVYGDLRGGFLLEGCLKLSLLAGPMHFGLYLIGQLQEQLETIWSLDSEIHFFMDAANVWFYGVKDGHLFVYDATFEELDDLGPLERALHELLSQWEDTIIRSKG